MPLTSAKAADLLGLSARQTRRLARAVRIVRASLLGRDWVFEHPLKVLPLDRAPGWPRRHHTAYGRCPPRRLMSGQFVTGQLMIRVCYGMRNSRTWPIPPVRADWRALEDSNL